MTLAKLLGYVPKKACNEFLSMKKIFLFLLVAISSWAIFSHWSENKCSCGKRTSEIAQYSYEGPSRPLPGNPQLIKVEVLVRDSPAPGGPEVKTVTFNRTSISLKPRDIYGNRGSAGFQLAPGKYRLRWVVEKNTKEWPREITREEEVTIDPKDLWLQIIIEGEDASIR